MDSLRIAQKKFCLEWRRKTVVMKGHKHGGRDVTKTSVVEF